MKRHPLVYGGLPESVIVEGKEYGVNWGYRAMMLVETAMYDENCNDTQKILNALNIFYLKNIPENIDGAMEQLLWFHRCGEEYAGECTVTKRTERYYSFGQDASSIYASFLSQYNVRLTQTRNYDLHWWEFKAMFDAVDGDSRMGRIIYYRTADTTGMGKDQKKFIQKMRKIYAIKGGAGICLDAKTKLAQRNIRMRDYVKKRYADADRKN